MPRKKKRRNKIVEEFITSRRARGVTETYVTRSRD
jgi:hypothetical protein